MCRQICAVVLKISCSGIFLHSERSRSSMDRMADSGSVGWAFESPRDHKEKRRSCRRVANSRPGITRQADKPVRVLPALPGLIRISGIKDKSER